jgi:hypothetical protein
MKGRMTQPAAVPTPGRGKAILEAHEPGDTQRLQRVALRDAGTQQPGGERLGGSAQLRPRQRHRPGSGLDLDWLVAVAHPRPCLGRLGGALVAASAQELIDLGL